MFLKKKSEDLVKGRRLVAGGHQQDKSAYENLSSPTIAMQSVFMIFAIAQHEKRYIVCLDIEGAYLNADMGPNEVLMKLDPFVSEILISMYSEYGEYLNPYDKCIYVKLNKALYGCVESAKLFYLHVKKSLNGIGFVENQYDPCVFNKTVDGNQITIGVHVDDLVITCVSNVLIKEFIRQLEDIYKKVKISEGKNHKYLGMTFIIDDSSVKVDMADCIREIIEENGVTGTATSPASNKLFAIDENSILLSVDDKESFHTNFAKLLYVSKRARPDILTAVSLLTSRVQNPNVEDEQKLQRVL
eukprot:gene18905-26771_t